MKAKELQELLDFIAKSGLDEVNIETEEYKIKVKKNADPKTQYLESPATGNQQVPLSHNSTSPVADHQGESNDEASESMAASDTNLVAIKSPMIGTFYRSSNPDTDPFVGIGDKVEKGQTVCIVEAMKLFNEIESEISGTVVKILVDDASPVEYDQPLFLVEPS